MNTSYPCEVCCDKCNIWAQKICNNSIKYYYRKLQDGNSPWSCLIFNLSNNQSKTFTSEKTIIFPILVEKKQNDYLIPHEFGATIKNNFYTTLELSKESHSLFMQYKHSNNISYDMQLFINELNVNEFLIGISESGLIKNKPPLTYITYQVFVLNPLQQSVEKGA